MKKSVIIGIIIAVIVLVIIVIFFIYPERECKTADDCLTKDCFTTQCTDKKCVYSPIPDCCGNEICEVGETYESCAADCPDCDDINDCTLDSYDYHEQKCVNKPIIDVVCCGNGICELGETYEDCVRDCPDCNDENQCTEDSYDYHGQKCVNKIIVPCCGNGICDEDVETYLDCPTDCPDYDDDNKLTTDSFNYQTQKCENPVTHYFIDDFEEGTGNWDFSGTEGQPTAWIITIEDGNTVLKGTGHNWAVLEEKSWTDYIFKTRFKIIKKLIHFNYRTEGPSRYFIGVESDGISLKKQINDSFYDLVVGKRISLDQGWHTFEIRGYNNILNIYLDDKLLIKYKDTEDPLLSGGVAFETLDDSEFLLDDVEIKLLTEEDVVYP